MSPLPSRQSEGAFRAARKPERRNPRNVRLLGQIRATFTQPASQNLAADVFRNGFIVPQNVSLNGWFAGAFWGRISMKKIPLAVAFVALTSGNASADLVFDNFNANLGHFG